MESLPGTRRALNFSEINAPLTTLRRAGERGGTGERGGLVVGDETTRNERSVGEAARTRVK